MTRIRDSLQNIDPSKASLAGYSPGSVLLYHTIMWVPIDKANRLANVPRKKLPPYNLPIDDLPVEIEVIWAMIVGIELLSFKRTIVLYKTQDTQKLAMGLKLTKMKVVFAQTMRKLVPVKPAQLLIYLNEFCVRLSRLWVFFSQLDKSQQSIKLYLIAIRA